MKDKLERWSFAIAVLAVIVATARIIATYPVFADVGDEPAHLACGVQYLAQHQYTYEPEHPPLVRAMIALGPYLSGVRQLGKEKFGVEGVTLLMNSGRPDQVLMLARLGVMPFFWLACAVVYLWARRDFGPAAAAAAVAVFSLTPTVLAHAGVANIDMGLTGTLAAAYFAFLLWTERPSHGRSVLWGVATAAAVLSKFTAFVFFPVTALLAAAVIWWTKRPRLTPYLPGFAIAVCTGAAAIFVAYFFSYRPLFEGIEAVRRLNAAGHSSFLLGEASWKGWWYYFPFALAVKTPLAILLLLAAGTWFSWKHRRDPRYLLPLAFCAGILAPALASRVDVGVRYILPIYVGFAVIAGAAAIQLMDRFKAGRIIVPALFVWLIATGAIAHPDYIPYFNELVGDGANVLADSDYDWGQDTKRLAIRLKQIGATQVNFNAMDRDWRNRLLEKWPGLPPVRSIDPTAPAEGWTAVNPTIDKALQYGLEYRYPNLQPWFHFLQPVERVGTLELYYLPPGSLKR